MTPADSQNKQQEQCKYNTIDMALYLLHKMEPETEVEFKAHIEQCDACRNKLAEIERSAQKLKKEFQEEKKQIKQKHRYFILKVIAAIFIVSIGAYFLFFQSPRQIPQGDLPPTYLHTDTIPTTDTIINSNNQ